MSIGKHELVDSAEAQKNGDWQNFSIQEPTQKDTKRLIIHHWVFF